ncbi:MAG: tail fiber domain-containing protein [Bacteroidota bacterium]
MKKHHILLATTFAIAVTVMGQGRVGINTNSPSAMLHVKDSSVLFSSGLTNAPASPGNPPASGTGIRMMWYADKAAFRTGKAQSNSWDKDKVGSYSFAAGNGVTASGVVSIALGNGTTASGHSSVATGIDTKATGFASTAMGEGTTASGDFDATAMGYFSTASGYISTAMGSETVASGYASTSMGNGTTASGHMSSTMGVGTVARSYSSLVIGRYNDSIVTSDKTTWLSADPVFIIGNGNAANMRSNAITVLKNGKTGINTSSPAAMLHIKDSSVLFSGLLNLPAVPGDPPESGTGIRMMWYPDKAAFRAGRAAGTNWDKASVGTYSFAAGNETTASGTRSSAFGDGTVASGSGSFTSGYKTRAIGTATVAMGDDNTASGYASAAMGASTIATGYISASFGEFSVASGPLTFATGSNTSANGANSTSMGVNSVANSFSSVVIGRNNDSIASSNKGSWIVTDPVFIIGNGPSPNSRSNALTILKNGKTGISTSTPEYGLHVVNNNTQDGGHIEGIMVESISTGPDVGEAAVSFKNQAFLSPNKKWITGLNQASNFRWDYDAQFGGGAAMVLDTTGDLTIQGSLSQSSDARLKKDITPLQNSLQKLLGLTGYHYNWLGSARGTKLQTGVLAQEIELQMPELVTTDGDGMKAVNYSGLTPYMIEAFKEQQQKITRLENELAEIKRLLLKKP